MKRTTLLVLALLLIAPMQGPVRAAQTPRGSVPAIARYLSPADGSQFVQSGATIALRLDGPIDLGSMSAALFNVSGTRSGHHLGRALLADDGRTVVFKPNTPFIPDEQVQVEIGRGLTTQSGAVYPGAKIEFHVSAVSAATRLSLQSTLLAAELKAETPTGDNRAPVTQPAAAPNAVARHPQDYQTFPDSFPVYTVTKPASGSAPGLLFMAPIQIVPVEVNNYLLITDDTGEPVYWQSTGIPDFDFKQQPDGSLTYFHVPDGRFHVLDNTYHEIKTIAGANGYAADPHDLQILPDGHALLLISDPEITSTVEFGGYLTATVVGLIIQELDTSGLPVFQWDSWSHFQISDTYDILTNPVVDYVHANAIEQDTDGNLLLSSRHMSEITKIDRDSGAIIWRLGGKHNEFSSLALDPGGPFFYQHDIRRLPNGNLTLFDNHNPTGPSRAVEYQIDEIAKVVTNTWQFSNSPAQFGPFTGNNQRLPNGNRLIDWGFSYPNVTEVLTDGTKTFELTLAPPYFSYRAFRSPWAAVPEWDPTLVLTGTLTPTLYYSWNGATDVASYNIYGGVGPAPNVLLGNQPRTGFEDHTLLSNLPGGYCAFRVQPIDHEARPQPFSNVVYTLAYCPAAFFPVIFR